jgi:hypothetical protein
LPVPHDDASPPLTVASVRRIYGAAFGAAAFVGLSAVALAAALGRPLIGIGAALGLALGAANSRGVGAMAVRLAEVGGGKRPAIVSSFRRLAAVTAVAVVVLVLNKYMGLATVAGLALFQMMMLGCTAKALLRSLREGAG